MFIVNVHGGPSSSLDGRANPIDPSASRPQENARRLEKAPTCSQGSKLEFRRKQCSAERVGCRDVGIPSEHARLVG